MKKKGPIFEPGAPPLEKRLEEAEAFCKAGITVGITAMPLLPILWDNPKALENLFSRLKSTAAYILPGTLTLRPGEQKEKFMSVLGNKYPELVPEYSRIYRENRNSGNPLFSYTKEIYGRIFDLLTEMEIPFQMPHGIYREKTSLVDEIHILLRHLGELYSPRGIDTAPVREAEKNYSDWLLPLRKEFNRKRSLPPDWMDLKLKSLAQSGKLGMLLNNPKLAEFISTVILEPVEFDYIKLKLKESSPRKTEGLF